MSWVIVHDQAGVEVATHKTKKQAEEQAREMTEAHAAVDALHLGQPISFTVAKAIEPNAVNVEEKNDS